MQNARHPKVSFHTQVSVYFFSCSQHLWQSQEQLTLKQLQRAMDTKWLYQQLHKLGKSPELISHDCRQRSFYHALLLKGGCTVEHIGAPTVDCFFNKKYWMTGEGGLLVWVRKGVSVSNPGLNKSELKLALVARRTQGRSETGKSVDTLFLHSCLCLCTL